MSLPDGVQTPLDLESPSDGVLTPLDDWSESLAQVSEKPPAAAPIAARPRRPAISGGSATGLHPSLQWAPAIEQSLIALVWQCPEQIGMVRQQLDERVHLTVPAHRHVLSAIEWTYRGMGCVSWTVVVAELCHIPGAFQECGGKAGLNTIYTDGGLVMGAGDPEPFIRYYIDFLKAAAVIRGVDPTRPVLHHMDAHGVLELNKLATSLSHPTVTGWIHVPLPGTYSLAGWPQGEVQLRLKGQLKRT